MGIKDSDPDVIGWIRITLSVACAVAGAALLFWGSGMLLELFTPNEVGFSMSLDRLYAIFGGIILLAASTKIGGEKVMR